MYDKTKALTHKTRYPEDTIQEAALSEEIFTTTQQTAGCVVSRYNEKVIVKT